MSRIIYSAIFYLLTPIILLRLLYRGLKAPAYRKRWAERFGFPVYAESTADCIWLHAVSVGETLAAVPLVKALQEKYPQHRLMVTCMTPTGSERIKAAFGDSVDHSYMPYDTPDAVARFLNRLKPKMLIIMETELWPNTIAACQSRDIPVILANGRLSARSAKAYHRISSVVQPMLSGISAVAAQHKDDGERFTQLGLPLSALAVTGNIKFDLSLDQAVQDRAAALSKQWHCGNNRPVFLAASTHRGEDEIILQAFGQIKQQLDNALLVLVPRHPERFDQVGELCTSAGFTLARHSAGDKVEAADVLLGDTMGELMVFFGACNVAFVGGSLVATGGHNMIEPAAWGVPVLTGPHLFNFTEASQLLLAADGMLVCSDAAELAEQCISLMGNKGRRQEMGNAARLVAEANRGALDKLMSVIDRFI
ncbi:lipid IV(A) 3-deoxy-D-manno-octulosonic acid transferase [Porticoccaceae bacterium]|nr:lipid IV(A) 3-deoxy-D-manno-octulosonic acid transferase [Porticoccaceae bacterium]